MAIQSIRIATRKSELAMWQANHIKQALQKIHPQLKIELIGMTTEGDSRLDTALNKIGGKGLFVKELEYAIQRGEADIAVHSMKDVPMELPSGFTIAAICERAAPQDAFVSNHYESLEALPKGATVGTSSLRRSCQLQAWRPDIAIKLLRGNVITRLKKLDEGEYDAIILAAAGLQRLNLAQRIRTILPIEKILPAAGQGAIGIECLSNNEELIKLLQSLEHVATRQCITAERALNICLHGGCHVPIGAYAVIQKNQIYLRGMVGQPDGKLILRAEINGDLNAPEILGEKLAKKLVQQGAEKILASL